MYIQMYIKERKRERKREKRAKPNEKKQKVGTAKGSSRMMPKASFAREEFGSVGLNQIF